MRRWEDRILYRNTVIVIDIAEKINAPVMINIVMKNITASGIM